MKIKLTFAALLTGTLLFAADSPFDLTGANADSFKAHLGEVIVLKGRLEQGMQGACLFNATPTNVVFYIIPDTPPSGSYAYPNSWEHLMHKRVRVIGELKFRSSLTGKGKTPPCKFLPIIIIWCFNEPASKALTQNDGVEPSEYPQTQFTNPVQ